MKKQRRYEVKVVISQIHLGLWIGPELGRHHLLRSIVGGVLQRLDLSTGNGDFQTSTVPPQNQSP